MTKIADPSLIRIAAVFGILFSVLGKVSALLKTIPEAVLGGIMLLLFGTIASRSCCVSWCNFESGDPK
jgi:uracil permease